MEVQHIKEYPFLQVIYSGVNVSFIVDKLVPKRLSEMDRIIKKYHNIDENCKYTFANHTINEAIRATVEESNLILFGGQIKSYDIKNLTPGFVQLLTYANENIAYKLIEQIFSTPTRHAMNIRKMGTMPSTQTMRVVEPDRDYYLPQKRGYSEETPEGTVYY